MLQRDRIGRVVDTAGLDNTEAKITNHARLRLALEQIAVASSARRLFASANPSVDDPLTKGQIEEVEDHF